MAAQYKVIHPVKYFRDYFANDVRPDNRRLTEFRDVKINVGNISTADGSATVRIGDTTVICGVKAELAKPTAEEPNKGFIVPNVDLPPLCSPKFRPGPPSEKAQILSQCVADIIKSSDCVNLHDICILPGHLVWVLHCDIICLNHDGAVLDACVASLIAALRTVKLPHVEHSAELDTTTVSVDQWKALPMNCFPVATSYAIFDDDVLLTDPTSEEESLCSGMVTVVVKGEELCSVFKPGGLPLPDTKLQSLIEGAHVRAQNINRLVESQLNPIEQ